MSLLMKALKRAEHAREPNQPAGRAATGMDPPPLGTRRDDLWRSSAIWSVAALLILGAAMYGYSLWRQPAPLVLEPGTATIAVAPTAPQGEPEATGIPTPAFPQQTPAAESGDRQSELAAPAVPQAKSASAADQPKTVAKPQAAVPDINPQISIHQSSESGPSPLLHAYQALQAGHTSQARALYLKALANDSGVDALLGLAAIAANGGDTRQAAAYYREALLREPNNGAALAGIASLASSGDPHSAQKPLERMAEKTGAASVRAALGNVYASQSKWQAAQQEYFEAFRMEPDNANHAYNLAVSLDQLGERALALEYYRKALVLGARGGAVFDSAGIERRLAELKSVTISQ